MTHVKILSGYFTCYLYILSILAQNNSTENTDYGIKEQLLKEVEEKLKEQEEFVSYIASEAESLYKNRQGEINACECSMHACSTIFQKANLGCYDKIRLNDGYCHDCKQEKIDPSKLCVRLPPGTDPSNLSNKLKSSICTFR